MALDYMDLKGQLRDEITVDEYAAKMGMDSDIVTVTFTTHSNLAAKDLVTWFERGYDFVLDASVSEGEIEPGIWLVFVEMERRSKVPSRICTLLADLETLTDIKLDEWSVDIEGDNIAADEERIREKMILNPNEYKAEKESDEKLNEFRELAGIETKRVYHEDEYTKNLKAIAGM
jgi:hypothetical protein